MTIEFQTNATFCGWVGGGWGNLDLHKEFEVKEHSDSAQSGNRERLDRKNRLLQT